MKKIILFIVLICFSTGFKAKAQGDYIVRVSISPGSQIPNPCTGGTLTLLSGILQFNFAPDGITIRSTVVYHQVLADAAGTKYHGIYLTTYEPIGTDGLINTFKMVLNPQGGGPSINLHGVFQISNVNGVPTVLVNKYTLDCQ